MVARVQCLRCGKDLAVQAGGAGKSVRCSGCRAEQLVRGSARREQREAGRSAWHWVGGMIAGGFVVMLFAALGARAAWPETEEMAPVAESSVELAEPDAGLPAPTQSVINEAPRATIGSRVVDILAIPKEEPNRQILADRRNILAMSQLAPYV